MPRDGYSGMSPSVSNMLSQGRFKSMMKVVLRVNLNYLFEFLTGECLCLSSFCVSVTQCPYYCIVM